VHGSRKFPEADSRRRICDKTSFRARGGENSLSINCLGVLLAFAAHAILVEVSAGFAMQLAVSIAAVVAMVVAPPC